MTKDEWQKLLDATPSTFYGWLWKKVALKQISKSQWFKLASLYERYKSQKELSDPDDKAREEYERGELF